MAEIIVKLPDEVYEDIKATYSGADVLYCAVKFGTPLPKGHGDLIDRKVLLNNGYQMEPVEMWYEIKYAPTIIEADKEVENDNRN